jgi:Tfp pilus assembly protein PilO
MSYRFFGVILISALIFQVAFSFYYSSEIINQNNLLDENQTLFDSLKKENLDLQNEIASINSLSNLSKNIENNSYQQIKEEINLNLP